MKIDRLTSTRARLRACRQRRPAHFERLERRDLLAAAVWELVSEHGPQPDLAAEVRASEYARYHLDLAELAESLRAAPPEASGATGLDVTLPTPDGTAAEFSVFSTSVMPPQLAARYPQIRTYVGHGAGNHAAATLRLDVTPAGFHAQVLNPGGSFYIDPITSNGSDAYAAYYASDVKGPAIELDAGGHPPTVDAHTHDITSPKAVDHAVAGRPQLTAISGSELRTYRAAIAATGEYTQFHGGTVADGLAAVVTAVNRVNGIFERDLSIRLELVPNNDRLIYTNASTDPYNNSSLESMLRQNQSNVDSVIGLANYDVGHVFGTSGGGLAFIASAGIDDPSFIAKARGGSGIPSPNGDGFWVNVVAHEFGHQFGANHTWNGTRLSCGPAQHHPPTAVEVGSGTTIMGYAGICGADNVQSAPDPFFHSISIAEIVAHVDAGIPNVGSRTATGNDLPGVLGGDDLVIPAETPFVLTASGFDADDSTLTYSWEQLDRGPQRNLDAGDDGEGPLFRARRPSSEATRYFPRLQDAINGTTPTGETLPTTTRGMEFRVAVRDNRGGVGFDDVQIQVVDTGNPFRVTTPNTAVTWSSLSQQTVRWDVAGTDGNGIDTSHVDILLSTDGGNSFDTVLVAETPNDGEQPVILPSTQTSAARIQVRGVQNPFFDTSNTNFTIGPPSAGVVAIESDGRTRLAEGNALDTYQLRLGSAPSGAVTVRVQSDEQTEVSADGINFVGSLDLTFEDVLPRTVTVRATDDSVTEGLHASRITHQITTTADAANYPTSLPINPVLPEIADNDLPGLQALGPLGGLISRGPIHVGRIGTEGVAEFSMPLLGGQTITAVITPHEFVSVEAAVVDLSGTSSATHPGAALTLPPVAVPQDGTFRLRVTADAATDFDLQLIANSSTELQLGDSDNGDELVIDGSTITAAGNRRAVIGNANVPVEPHFALSNDPGAFVNIVGRGTLLNISDDGTATINTTVGNEFFPAGSVTVGNNGVIVSGGTFPSVPFNNGTLPSANFGNALVPFWDDLIGPNPGAVLWHEQTIEGVRALIVQWHEREHFDTFNQGTGTFQVQVFESGPVLARFSYLDVHFGDLGIDGGASATIGYQESQTSAIQYSFEKAVVSNGDVLELRLISPDVDEYELDLSDAVGGEIDVQLVNLDGQDSTQQTLELLAPDGSTVLNTARPDPLVPGVPAENCDLGIIGAPITAGGHYTLRVSSLVSGDYALVVSAAATLEVEPNDNLASGSIRSLNDRPGIGYLDAQGSDSADLYRVEVTAGRRLTVESQTLFDGPSLLPANTLHPQLELLTMDGQPVPAEIERSPDGRNMRLQLTVAEDTTYLVRVSPEEGSGSYRIATIIDDPPQGLFVASITPTSTGFVAEFSEDLVTDDLNLYDSQAANLGPSDVSLVGLNVGPVVGSLVLGPGSRRVTFVATGGPLADDEYMLKLRGGEDGFVSTGGDRLDGDRDGTAGDDFLSSFVHESPPEAIVISVPDFVRGPAQPVELPATSGVGIPISISDGSGVRAIDVRIDYDPELLEITAASVGADLPSGASVILNATTPGLAVLVFFSPETLPGGETTIAQLTASVPGGEASSQTQFLDLHSITISDGNDNEFATVDDDAVHLVSYFGDVSANGRINASDAAQIARIAALLDSGFAAAPLIDPRIVADVSGNGRINAADASLVARAAALIPVEQIPPIPANAAAKAAMSSAIVPASRAGANLNADASTEGLSPLVEASSGEFVGVAEAGDPNPIERPLRTRFRPAVGHELDDLFADEGLDWLASR